MPTIPGLGTTRHATHRDIFRGSSGQGFLQHNIVVDATFARDPLNVPVTILQAGTLLGRITATGLYAPSIIGVAGEAMNGSETAMTVAAAVVTELVRRIGNAGTFTLFGPAVAGGVPRALTVTYSAAAGTTITLTAMGATDVQVFTLAAGTDGGTFQVRYGTVVTAGLAWNIAAADLQVALRALHAELAAVVVGLVGEIYTITNPLDVPTSGLLQTFQIINDSTMDGGVWEGGIVVTRTGTGISGEFVTGSLIMGTDGSQSPSWILADPWGLQMVDEDMVDRDAQPASIPISGEIDTTMLVNWPADAGLVTALKALLRVHTPALVFSDEL